MSKIYVGYHRLLHNYQVLRSATIPSAEEYGQANYDYSRLVGPFKTVRGAKYMAKWGHSNIMCVTVSDAERLAKEYAMYQRTLFSFVLLRGIKDGNRFFSTHKKGADPTTLNDGTVAYTIIGYATSIEDAQMQLYGRTYKWVGSVA